MKKEKYFIRFIILVTIFLIVVLGFLSMRRKFIPIHINVKVNKLKTTIGKDTDEQNLSNIIIKNWDISEIEITDFDKLELYGLKINSNNSKTTDHYKKFKFEPIDETSYIFLAGNLKITELSVENKTDIELSPKLHLKITGGSQINLLLSDTLSIIWENCKVSESDNTDFGKIKFLAGNPFLSIKDKRLLNLYMHDASNNQQLKQLENEIPILSFDFIQERFSDYKPDLTTTIIDLEIIFPTLANESPIILPAGSYLEINNLKNFILKDVKINSKGSNISTNIYGYTNDLKAAYGRGKLTQLLPSKLLLIYQNINIVIMVLIIIWFVKTMVSIYNQINDWKKQ